MPDGEEPPRATDERLSPAAVPTWPGATDGDEAELQNVGRLLVTCPDRPGIVAAVSRFLFEAGANIVQAQQHSSQNGGGTFFLRMVFALSELSGRLLELERGFQPLAQRFEMEWRLVPAARRKRLGIFVSRAEHALLELLWAHRAGDLRADLALVISNHAQLQPTVRAAGVPFFHVPVTPAGNEQAEAEQLRLLKDAGVDTVVLARYMQVLSSSFLAHYPAAVINIHHGFLPAFAGADPYAQAFRRGVKLIGATAHYVTEELDQGPIIEQDVERVDHRHGPAELRRIGRMVERVVLARAVTWHVEDRVLLHEGSTIVFT